MIKNIRSTSAFTLIEMLIVVAIIGIIVGIGVPALRDAKEKSIAAKQAAALANVATAKTRYILDYSATALDSDVANEFSDLSGYLLVAGVAPATDTDILANSQGGPVIYGNSNTAPVVSTPAASL